ncbi:MAG TPA: heavy metal-binding domain-containing protein [Phenylobacterium sp.]|uniref:heavy metal-binding domain-containing protein n=1 Tax=Phenylobacterium sp. TaxID=1871053 RepID=UPI002C2E177D|nr:heavy metal-binding domain-containing protein [Phenylobacterium sp.]HXA39373.1 heavy metal-binding domain-containing protein [Phenylobacterium sp.]
MRFYMRPCAAIAALFSVTAPLGASAAQAGSLPVYEVASASPPVDRVISQVRVRECRTDATDARSAALARLSQKASSLGANGLVHVRVEVAEAYQRTIKNGMPNPCLYQTVARGDAAVLSGSGPGAPQVAVAPN